MWGGLLQDLFSVLVNSLYVWSIDFLFLSLTVDREILDNSLQVLRSCENYTVGVGSRRKKQAMAHLESRGWGEQGVKSPFSLPSEPISPSSLLFEPISPSSLNGYVSFSPSSLLFPPISPSSQLFLGHFSLLPILFLSPQSSIVIGWFGFDHLVLTRS